MRTKMVALALVFPAVLITAKRTHAQSPTSLSSTINSSSGTAASSTTQDQPRAEDPGVQRDNRNTGVGVVSLSAADGSLQFFSERAGPLSSGGDGFPRPPRRSGATV
jgi:hypothetical protein